MCLFGGWRPKEKFQLQVLQSFIGHLKLHRYSPLKQTHTRAGCSGTHPYNPSTRGAQWGGLQVEGQPGLHSETLNEKQKIQFSEKFPAFSIFWCFLIHSIQFLEMRWWQTLVPPTQGGEHWRIEEYFEIVLLAHKTFAYKKNTQITMQY